MFPDLNKTSSLNHSHEERKQHMINTFRLSAFAESTYSLFLKKTFGVGFSELFSIGLIPTDFHKSRGRLMLSTLENLILNVQVNIPQVHCVGEGVVAFWRKGDIF